MRTLGETRLSRTAVCRMGSAKRNGAGGRFGLPSAFWGMAGVWLGCVGFHVSAALGAGVGSGVSCWPRGGSVPETREVPPKTA